MNDNLKEILSYGTDFNQTINEFNDLIRGINDTTNKINQSRVELINHIFKHSKRKILFEYNFQGKNDNNSHKYKIGINTGGLGILDNWSRNMRNIDDYYTKRRFLEMIENEDFKKLLTENVKEEYKPILPMLFGETENEIDEKIEIDNICIEICNSGLNFIYNDENGNREFRFRIIKSEIENFSEIKLNEFSELNYNYDYSEITKYAYLLQFKEKIINCLDKIKSKYEAKEKEINKLDKYINNYLNPFKALEKI